MYNNLSKLVDLLRSQEQYHRDELLRLKRLRQRAQAQIPNDAFADFLSQLQQRQETPGDDAHHDHD